MKQKSMIAALALVALQTSACGDIPVYSSEAVAHVFAEVPASLRVDVVAANVAISPDGFVTIDLPDSAGAGLLTAEITFHVSANVERVKMAVLATDLYKDASALSPYIIPVKAAGGSDGAGVRPAYGYAVAGRGDMLPWTRTTTLNNMNGWLTELVEFESGQAGRFSQDVAVTVQYDHDVPDLPAGQYSGWVKLVCQIDP